MWEGSSSNQAGKVDPLIGCESVTQIEKEVIEGMHRLFNVNDRIMTSE